MTLIIDMLLCITVKYILNTAFPIQSYSMSFAEIPGNYDGNFVKAIKGSK